MHIGSTISHYKIVEKLGEGGMGVVYKAEDTKLERTVALKFLAQHLLNDEEAKARFLREAKAAAALHHSNVCPVYEIDEVDGNTFMAMAFLQGETLEQQLAKGPRDIRDALDIGRQVADGLEAAHEAGIVHRDIKPANILVDAKGHATIMDFGLARLTEASRLTKVGTAMGTVAYMSPEQAQGMDVDSRSDIWSLGCALYEMVAGQRPFQGQYDQALLYEIVHEEPAPLTSVRAGVPMELEFIVGKSLAKDPGDRYQRVDDIAVDLRTLAEKLKSGRSATLRTTNITGAAAVHRLAETANPSGVMTPDTLPAKKSERQWLLAVTAVFALAFFSVSAIHWSEREPEKPLRRFSLSPGGLATGSISPDGRLIAYVVRGDPPQVWVRDLSNEEAREFPGTEGAQNECCAWSADSQFFVFATNSELKRVSIDGGAVITLCRLPDLSVSFQGASWSPDGQRIAFSSGLRLYQVSSRGGEPQPILDLPPDSQLEVQNPHYLPDDGPPALLYWGLVLRGGARLGVLNLETGERRDLGPGSDPFYSREGYVISETDVTAEGGLQALPIDRGTLGPAGEAFPITTKGGRPSVSNDGTLAYRNVLSDGAPGSLVVRDRAGEIVRTMGSAVDLSGGVRLSVSPDALRVAAGTANGIWIYDLSRETATRLAAPDGVMGALRWLNNTELSFALNAREFISLAVDGSREAQTFYEGLGGSYFDWSPDRRILLFTSPDPAGGDGGLWYIERQADGTFSDRISYLRTAYNENNPQFSPDGRFVAYQSDESGRYEVYIRPFPEGPGKWQVSTNGGGQPGWASNGRELFFVQDSVLMAAALSGGSNPDPGPPERLFDAGLPVRYGVLPGKSRFVMVHVEETGSDANRPAIALVENWFEEFRDRE